MTADHSQVSIWSRSECLIWFTAPSLLPTAVRWYVDTSTRSHPGGRWVTRWQLDDQAPSGVAVEQWAWWKTMDQRCLLEDPLGWLSDGCGKGPRSRCGRRSRSTRGGRWATGVEKDHGSEVAARRAGSTRGRCWATDVEKDHGSEVAARRPGSTRGDWTMDVVKDQEVEVAEEISRCPGWLGNGYGRGAWRSRHWNISSYPGVAKPAAAAADNLGMWN